MLRCCALLTRALSKPCGGCWIPVRSPAAVVVYSSATLIAVWLVVRLCATDSSRVLLLMLPKLATKKSVRIHGVVCDVFCNHALPGDLFGVETNVGEHAGDGASPTVPTVGDGPDCLLYIHGGGFIGSSFANDAQLIVDWAKRTNLMVRRSIVHAVCGAFPTLNAVPV